MINGFDYLISGRELSRGCDDLWAGACGENASTEALDACLTVLLTAGDTQAYVEILCEVEAGSRGFPAQTGATAAGIALAKLMTGTYRSASEYCIRALDVF